MKAVLISGSPSATSRSRVLLEHAGRRLETGGCPTTLVDLSRLSAEALLGRAKDDGVTRAIEAVMAATIVVASSPTYRATYTGLLKAFFDLILPDSFVGKVGVPILTGGSPAHQLAVDHSFRPLFASLGATVVNGIYAWDAQLKNGPDPQVLEALESSLTAALALGRAGG